MLRIRKEFLAFNFSQNEQGLLQKEKETLKNQKGKKMTRKEKFYAFLLIMVVLLGGILNVLNVLGEATMEDRIYIEITDSDRQNGYLWTEAFADYGDVKVNWYHTKNQNGIDLYEVHKNGFTYWWSKECIAEYVTNR